MLKQRVKHYYQWLHSTIYHKTKLNQSSCDSFRIQGPSKRSSSGLLFPVTSVKECNRKGGKCKISWVLQSPVSGPQASSKVEASDRRKQAQHPPTYRKVQNGNSRVHQGLSDSRGMCDFDRPVGRLSSHPHPQVFTGVSVHLPPFQPSQGPTGLYDDFKGSDDDDPHKVSQTSPIPGRLAYHIPVLEGSTSEHSDHGKPDTVDPYGGY